MDSQDYNEYYLGENDEIGINLMTIKNKTHYDFHSAFGSYLESLDANLDGLVGEYGKEYWKPTKNGLIAGYEMPNNWKMSMIDDIINDETLEDMEKYINEIGIDKATKIVMECPYYDDELPDITDEVGLKHFFLLMMYEIIGIGEGIQQVEKEEFFNKISLEIDE